MDFEVYFKPRKPWSSPKRGRHRDFCRIPTTGARQTHGTVTTSWYLFTVAIMQCLSVREDTLSFNVPANGHTLRKRDSEVTLIKRRTFFRQLK